MGNGEDGQAVVIVQFPGQSGSSKRVVGAILQETGEPVHLTAHVYRPLYAFLKGNFGAVGFADLEEFLNVAQKQLSKGDLLLALRLPVLANRHNVMVVRYKDAHRRWGIGRVVLSRTLGKLIKCGYLRRNSPGSFTLNPNWIWTGKTRDHREAITEWNAEDGKQKVVEAGEGIDDSASPPRPS